MFVKPLNLIIVYILTIINFIILLLPFTAVVFAVVNIDQEYFTAQAAAARSKNIAIIFDFYY